MSNSFKGALIFIGIIIISFLAGSFILSATFFGTLTLVGLIVLIESIPPLKWICSRLTRVIDIIIFAFSIMAIAQYGLTIAASLTVAGLGYTLVYAPYLREKRAERKNKPDPIPNYLNKFNQQ